MEIRSGCMGWAYPDWVGPFYPEGTKPSDFLRLYSGAFDTVEVDSSFYRTPAAQLVRSWVAGTPPSFRFSLKLVKSITHDAKFRSVEKELAAFLKNTEPLSQKTLATLIQCPPSLMFERDWDAFSGFLEKLKDEGRRWAVEFRHGSWFRDETYELLRSTRTCFAWAYSQYLETPPEATTDFLYLRFVGDRALTKFDRLQKDRREVTARWARRLSNEWRIQPTGAFVFFNNHYAGFAPASANQFREIAGLPPFRFPSERRGSTLKERRTLSDYLR